MLQTVDVGGPSAFQGLVQFDLSTLPSGITSANVSKATVVLFVKAVNAAGTVNISAANGAWTESGVNGNNAPAAGAAGERRCGIGGWFLFVCRRYGCGSGLGDDAGFE